MNFVFSRGHFARYTAVPVILLGTWDRDVEPETALRAPRLYRSGPDDRDFNRVVFSQWMAAGLGEACLAVFCAAVAANASLAAGRADGATTGLWEAGATAFTVIVIIANTKLALNQYRFTAVDAVAYFLSVFSWFGVGAL